jgi:hypothetical protein
VLRSISEFYCEFHVRHVPVSLAVKGSCRSDDDPVSLQPDRYFPSRQSASWMRCKSRQSVMKRLDGRCSDLFHYVQQPQLRGIPRSHRRPVPGVCRLPSTAATGALSPMLGQTYRAPRAMSVAGDSGERWQPLFRHLLDPKPKSHKAISPVTRISWS